MKVNIFYSWQSDLPNNKNRSLIEDCINKALKNVFEANKVISEYYLDSDSRNEAGTPDLVSSIFSKIDICDIFICDISIVNGKERQDEARLMPNPNVMIELGYAAKSIDWSNIICIFNKEFGEIEDLPFDIRFRKPITYNSAVDTSAEKKKLVKLLESSLCQVFNQRLSDKKHYQKTKRSIDLGMQAILIDFTKLLFRESGNAEKYNYPRLLNSSMEDILGVIKNKEFLGFELFKNLTLNINDFTDFFNNDINTYFLTDLEKKLIVKIIYALREFKEILDTKNFSQIESNNKYRVISASEMNAKNTNNSYILLEVIDKEKGIVIDSGVFEEEHIKLLLNRYVIPHSFQTVFVNAILNITSVVNDWIKTTGNYFIINNRLIEND